MNKKYARTLAENNKFRFYCTYSPEMLLRGIDVELNMFSDQNECKKQLITKLKSNIKNIQQFDLLLYLPGGVPFLKGKLKDIFSNDVKPEVKRNIYGVLTRPIQNEDLNKNYTRLPDLTKDQKKLFFSPICESTSNGLCDIACLLDYCKQNGKYCSKFQNILSSIIPFPPFSTCLQQLIENKYFTGRDIITITSTLHTYFSHLIKMSKPPPQIFEYTLKLINIIIKNEEPQNPPIQEINLQEHLQEDNFWPLTVFDRSNETFQFWRGDLVGFKDDYYELNQIDIDEIGDEEENIFSCILSRGISIIRGEDHCYLCFNEGEQFKSNYKVVDPITNTIKTIGNIEELINSKFCIESKNISNFIDNESIKQITFICFEEFLLSSIQANQYLTWFVQNTNEYNVSCLLGLIVFSNELKIISPLVLPWENIDRKICGEPKSNDKSCLWDAISFACDQLSDNGNVYKKAVKRILVISNSGNDSLSQMNLQKISIKTLRHKVLIDSIILNETEKSKELATLCHISGGYSFKFKTLEDSLQLFDKLSFLDIKYRLQSQILLIEGDRSTQCKYLNYSDMTDDFIQKAIGMAKFDKDILNSVRFKMQHENKYATPRHICYVNWNSNIPDSRKRRILRELHAAACCMDEKNSHYDPDIIVLPQQLKLDCWMVFLKGIDDTPYEGKWFCLYVTFPDLYPIEPPNIRFFSAPYHLNISHDGSICFDFLYNSYDPQLHMIDIIQNIKVLFVIPFEDCPLRIDALDDYMNDKSLYMRKAKESAKNVGKNDYHEFLAHHSFINDDVSNDFKIEITDHIPPYMMSQISGEPIQGSFNAYCDKTVLSIENDEDDDDDLI